GSANDEAHVAAESDGVAVLVGPSAAEHGDTDEPVEIGDQRRLMALVRGSGKIEVERPILHGGRGQLLGEGNRVGQEVVVAAGIRPFGQQEPVRDQVRRRSGVGRGGGWRSAALGPGTSGLYRPLPGVGRTAPSTAWDAGGRRTRRLYCRSGAQG